MIISKDFVYGHIGKTGGDAVHDYFSKLQKKLNLTIDSTAVNFKHASFFERLGVKLDSDNKKYVLSIRRLPSVARSLLVEIDFVKKTKEWNLSSPADTPDNAFKISFDDQISKFEVGGYKITNWFRMEHLLDDVVDFCNKELNLKVNKELFGDVKTKGQRSYNHDPFAFFSRQQMAKLYALNPKWAEVEKNLYGNLLISKTKISMI